MFPSHQLNQVAINDLQKIKGMQQCLTEFFYKAVNKINDFQKMQTKVSLKSYNKR